METLSCHIFQRIFNLMPVTTEKQKSNLKRPCIYDREVNVIMNYFLQTFSLGITLTVILKSDPEKVVKHAEELILVKNCYVKNVLAMLGIISEHSHSLRIHSFFMFVK